MLIVLTLLQLVFNWSNAIVTNNDIIEIIDHSLALSNQQESDSLTTNQRIELKNITLKLWDEYHREDRVSGNLDVEVEDWIESLTESEMHYYYHLMRDQTRDVYGDYYNYEEQKMHMKEMEEMYLDKISYRLQNSSIHIGDGAARRLIRFVGDYHYFDDTYYAGTNYYDDLADYYEDDASLSFDEMQELMDIIDSLSLEDLLHYFNIMTSGSTVSTPKRRTNNVITIQIPNGCISVFNEIAKHKCSAFGESCGKDGQCTETKSCPSLKISPFNPKKKTEVKCFTGESSKSPIFIRIKDSRPNAVKTTYWSLKNCARCAINDYVAMKFVKWFKKDVLNKVYPDAKQRPIIQEYGVVHIGAPPQNCPDESETVIYLTQFLFKKNDWIVNTGTKVQPKYEFGAVNNKCHKSRKRKRVLVNSLRGTSIMNVLLRIKDRHAKNIWIKKCTAMQTDFESAFTSALEYNPEDCWDITLPYCTEMEQYMMYSKIDVGKFRKTLLLDFQKVVNKLKTKEVKRKLEQYFLGDHYATLVPLCTGEQLTFPQTIYKTAVNKMEDKFLNRFTCADWNTVKNANEQCKNFITGHYHLDKIDSNVHVPLRHYICGEQ